MDKINIKEAIVVEGHYDAQRLKEFIGSVIIETDGFAVFKDKSIQQFIIKFAKNQGIIILTDSDTAGFRIRSFVAQLVPQELVKHAYIPEIAGVEKRKQAPSKEGLLGVEGVGEKLLKESILSVANRSSNSCKTFDTGLLYSLGLSGKPDSANKRRQLLKELGLPTKLTTKSICRILPYILTIEQLKQMIR